MLPIDHFIVRDLGEGTMEARSWESSRRHVRPFRHRKNPAFNGEAIGNMSQSGIGEGRMDHNVIDRKGQDPVHGKPV